MSIRKSNAFLALVIDVLFRYAAWCLSDLVKILRDGGSGSDSSARCPLLNRLTQTSTIEKGFLILSLECIKKFSHRSNDSGSSR